jgi:inner membrane protein
MPSPIAHLTAGYLVYLSGRRVLAREAGAEAPDGASRLLVLALSFSLLPDADSAAGLLLGDFGRYHNNGTHSLLVGAAVSLATAGIIAWQRGGFRFWFLVAAASYGLHLLMDAATVGRGIMAFWPLSEQRFLSPLPVFYGLHWSDGWVSPRHLWTAVTELAFAAVVLSLWSFLPGRRQAQA